MKPVEVWVVWVVVLIAIPSEQVTASSYLVICIGDVTSVTRPAAPNVRHGTSTSALADTTVDPLAMMTSAKNLPTSHYDDYSVVFN
jgi:hypothetical protein